MKNKVLQYKIYALVFLLIVSKPFSALYSVIYSYDNLVSLDAYAKPKDKDKKKDKSKKNKKIKVKNESVLNFGTIAKPNSGSVDVVVTRHGSLGGGTTAMVLGTTSISAGREEIKAHKHKSIQIAFSDCASNSSIGLEISNFNAQYGGVVFLNNGVGLYSSKNKETLEYGATLKINSNAQTGSFTPCYNIFVNYD